MMGILWGLTVNLGPWYQVENPYIQRGKAKPMPDKLTDGVG